MEYNLCLFMLGKPEFMKSSAFKAVENDGKLSSNDA